MKILFTSPSSPPTVEQRNFPTVIKTTQSTTPATPSKTSQANSAEYILREFNKKQNESGIASLYRLEEERPVPIPDSNKAFYGQDSWPWLYIDNKQYRLNPDLFKIFKIKYSGESDLKTDNSLRNYLIKQGVPEERIVKAIYERQQLGNSSCDIGSHGGAERPVFCPTDMQPKKEKKIENLFFAPYIYTKDKSAITIEKSSYLGIPGVKVNINYKKLTPEEKNNLFIEIPENNVDYIKGNVPRNYSAP